MLAYVARRIVYAIPIVLSVALVCFLLVHITPGDPLVAVLPALRSPGAAVPAVSLLLTLGSVFASGFLWTWAATTLAFRGPLLAALRNE